LEADFLIIGSGIAGLVAAHRAKEYGSVLLITKERAHDSNTEKAQGGIAAAIDADDSPFFAFGGYPWVPGLTFVILML